MNIKEVIVVEGKNDTAKLKSIFKDISTIETNGSEINEPTLNLIKKAHKIKGAIIFTDPDAAGNKIRSLIENYIPDIKHAFLAKQDAISKNKKKVGIEHATEEVIIASLKNVYTISPNKTLWKLDDLYQLALIGHKQSAFLRTQVSKHFNLGHLNSKKLLSRLNMFEIKKQDVIDFLNSL